jgi:hypothetical protein
VSKIWPALLDNWHLYLHNPGHQVKRMDRLCDLSWPVRLSEFFDGKADSWRSMSMTFSPLVVATFLELVRPVVIDQELLG